MAAQKQTKVLTRRKKFQPVSVPMAHLQIELIGNSIEELKGKSVKLDLTRQLKGKGIEAKFIVEIIDGKAVAHPKKIVLMSHFIRRMIRKRISYIEDSFSTPTQESMVIVKPFLITRKKVSKAVRRTLRNLTKNWIEDEFARMNDLEIFEEIITNKIQKALSIKLKKTYPLSLCEIRVLEIKRPLEENEIPKVEPRPKAEVKTTQADEINDLDVDVSFAEKEIKDTQAKAAEVEDDSNDETSEEDEGVVDDSGDEVEVKDEVKDSSAKAEEGEKDEDAVEDKDEKIENEVKVEDKDEGKESK